MVVDEPGGTRGAEARAAGRLQALRGWLRGERIAALLIGFGIAIRVRLYLANFSLEVAEAELATNLVGRSFAGLLQPLDQDQAAPIGFLMLERLALILLGNHELVLRLFPMACGIASLFLFRALAKRLLSPVAANVSLGLFTVSPLVIYFSNQVKQYSSDVTIALLLLLVALWARRRRLEVKSSSTLAVVGGVAVWLSHPAVLVLGGIGATWAWFELRGRRWPALARLVLCGAVWGASFIALYLLSLRHLTSNPFLMSYWGRAFMPLPPTSIADLRWFPETYFTIFANPGGLFASGLGAALFLIGLLSLGKRDIERCAMLVSPLLLAVLASGLGRFPFSGRVILFLVPSLLLLISEGIERIRELTWASRPEIAVVLVGVLALDPLASQTLRLLTPRPFDESRSVIAYLAAHIREQDTVYLYYDAVPLFRYYAPRFGIEDRPYVAGTSAEDRWSDDLRDLAALRGRPRVWLMFAHVFHRERRPTEEDFFLFQLEGMGRQLDAFKAPGASVYLYDLEDGRDRPGSAP